MNMSQLQIGQRQSLIAIADNTTLEKVKSVLESERSFFIDKINEFLGERNGIARLYSKDLIPIIRDIVTAVDEEVPLEGGCGLPYCRKPNTTNSESDTN